MIIISKLSKSINLLINMHGPQTKNAPAHNGARFDPEGFCLTHNDVRLCRLASDGKYKLVRKICFKCGTNGHVQKTKLHEYRKKSMPHREVSSEFVSAGDSSNRTSGGGGRRSSKKAERRPDRAQRRRNIQNPPARNATAIRPRRSISPINRNGDRRRGRTLSPLRKSLPNKSSIRPASSDEVMKQKITRGKINELMDLMPPLYRPSSTKASSAMRASQQSNTPGGRGGTSKSSGPSAKQKLPFDRNGYCKSHPEVCLAEKDPKGGGWNVVRVSGVCPQCCVSAVLACKEHQSSITHSTSGTPNLIKKSSTKSNAKKSSTTDSDDSLIGKVLMTTTSDESHQTAPTSPSSSYPSTPESGSKPAFSAEYFTSANRNIIGLALDIQRGERIVAELNTALSEATIKHRNVGDVRRSIRARARDPCPCKEPPGRRL